MISLQHENVWKITSLHKKFDIWLSFYKSILTFLLKDILAYWLFSQDLWHVYYSQLEYIPTAHIYMCVIYINTWLLFWPQKPIYTVESITILNQHAGLYLILCPTMLFLILYALCITNMYCTHNLLVLFFFFFLMKRKEYKWLKKEIINNYHSEI